MKMKTNIKLTLLILTTLSCVWCEDIQAVRGYERGNAIINCPYGNFKGYQKFPKYLLKGNVEVIRSNRHREWTRRGRFTLQDKKNRKIFSVTIHNLTLEDAGIYWCGVDTWGVDFYTKVILKVDSATSPVTTSRQPRDDTVPTSESGDATHIKTDPTSVYISVLTGFRVYIGACLAVLVLMLVLSLCMLFTQKTRGRKSSTPPAGLRTNTSFGKTPQVQCDYAELVITPGNSVPQSSDASAIISNVSLSSNQNSDSVKNSPICLDRDDESLQYSTVRFTDRPAGGDTQGSIEIHERS